MPIYLHGMESTEQKIARRLEQLRTRKKHLMEDISLTQRSLEHHQNNKEMGQQTYYYWQKKHPGDSLEDYINILQDRVNRTDQLLKKNQKELNDILQEMDQLDVLLKGEEKEDKNGKNDSIKSYFIKSEKM